MGYNQPRTIMKACCEEGSALDKHSTHKGFKQSARRTFYEIGAVLLFVGLLIGGLRGCADKLTDRVLERLPATVDARIGETAAAAQRARYASTAAPREASERVGRVFSPLERGLTPTERSRLLALRVTTVRDEQVNAFALPGGEIFVLTGLTERLRTDDLALQAVLAHELGHAVKRHGVRAMVRAQVFPLAMTLLTGGAGSVGATLVGAASQAESLRYSRSMESEADAFAVSLLSRTGGNAEGLARFLESLGSAPIPQWLSTHPEPAERARAIRLRIRQGGNVQGVR